jgi:hypothetical protein
MRRSQNTVSAGSYCAARRFDEDESGLFQMNLAGNVAHYRIVNFDDWAESLVRVRFNHQTHSSPAG